MEHLKISYEKNFQLRVYCSYFYSKWNTKCVYLGPFLNMVLIAIAKGSKFLCVFSTLRGFNCLMSFFPTPTFREPCIVLVRTNHPHATGLWFYPVFVKQAIMSPCFPQSIKTCNKCALSGQMRSHECGPTGKMVRMQPSKCTQCLMHCMQPSKCTQCLMHCCACCCHYAYVETLKLWPVQSVCLHG